MADAESRLTYAFDENSTGLLPVLRAARAEAHDRLTDLPALGIPPGTLDAPMLRELGQRGRFALIARDGRMLGPVVQREAWREAGVTLFLLGGKWGKLGIWEISRRVIFLWPSIVAHAEASKQGAAWRVGPAVPSPAANAIRRVTGRHADPEAA